MTQHRLPEPSRLADRFHRWAFRGYWIAARIAPVWPRWLELIPSRWVVYVIMAVYPRPKRMIRRNLAHILGRHPGSWRVRRACTEMLGYFGIYHSDLFRFAQLPMEEARAHLDVVQGMEHLEAAVASGKGALMLTAHFGNYELGGVLLGQLDMPVSVVYVKDKFEQAEEYRSVMRGRGNVEEIAIEPNGELVEPAGAARAAGGPARGDAGRPRPRRARHPDPLLRAADPLPARAVPGRAADRRSDHPHVRGLLEAAAVRVPDLSADRAAADGGPRARPGRGGGALGRRARAGAAPLAGAVVHLLRLLRRPPGRSRGRSARARSPSGERVSPPLLVATAGGERTLAELALPLDLGELVPGEGEWEVEIGFGKGRYLLRRAAGEPGARFAGIEVAPSYYRMVVERARRRGLGNLLVIRGQAQAALAAVLPRGFASAVHVYFPDPWPKSRHERRRLFEPESVDLVLGLLRPGGTLWFATDFVAYGETVEASALGPPPRDRPSPLRRLARGAAHELRGQIPAGGAPDLAPGSGVGRRRRCRRAPPAGSSRGPRGLPVGRCGRGGGNVSEAGGLRALRGLLPYFRPYRRVLGLGIAAILAGAVVGMAAPLLVGRAVDSFHATPSPRHSARLRRPARARRRRAGRLQLPAAHALWWR